jgi:dephospho-CoA kinase
VLQEPSIVAAISRKWPKSVTAGTVERSLLARTVFSEPSQLAALESLTHPRILDRITDWLAKTPGKKVIEVSVPRLISRSFGTILVVDAPKNIRVERLMARGMSADEIGQRMSNQPPRWRWLELADIVLDNRFGDVSVTRMLDFLDSR